MSADEVTAIIARVEQQERDLVFTTFTHDDAWHDTEERFLGHR